MSGRVVFPRPVQWLTTASTPRGAWLASRRQGIGGSDVAAVLGRSRFATAWSVWAEKTGRAQPWAGNERAGWGQELEDVVARTWAADHGARIRRLGMVADPQHPWRLASLDRAVLAPGSLRAEALLEVKTTSERSGGLDHDDILDRYRTQTQWYLGITGLDEAHLAVLVGGQELRRYTILFDPDAWHEMTGVVDAFWRNHIEGDVPPPLVLDDAEHTRSIAADPEAKPVVADDGALQLLAERRRAKAQGKTAESEVKLLDARIRALMGGATELVDSSDQVLATWQDVQSKQLDQKRLREELTEIWERYRAPSTVRKFVVKEPRQPGEQGRESA